MLPGLLDALWCCGHDGHVRPARTHHTHCQCGALNPGKEQHCHQPHNIHPYEQTGKLADLSTAFILDNIFKEKNTMFIII